MVSGSRYCVGGVLPFVLLMVIAQFGLFARDVLATRRRAVVTIARRSLVDSLKASTAQITVSNETCTNELEGYFEVFDSLTCSDTPLEVFQAWCPYQCFPKSSPVNEELK